MMKRQHPLESWGEDADAQACIEKVMPAGRGVRATKGL